MVVDVTETTGVELYGMNWDLPQMRWQTYRFNGVIMAIALDSLPFLK